MLLAHQVSLPPPNEDFAPQMTWREPDCVVTAVQFCPDMVTLKPYAEYLAQQLNGQLIMFNGRELPEADLRQQLTREHDLLVLGQPPRALLRCWLGRRGALPDKAPMLVARQPRWPLKRILLVVRADGQDATAVTWAGRLAQATHAAVTLLAMVPALPAMYGPQFQQQAGVDVLLAPTTSSGGQLRTLAQHLADNQINTALHLRPGEPIWQLRWEMAENNPDLVVLAEEPRPRWPAWLHSELVLPLLDWIDRPLLVTRPTGDGYA